MCAGNSLVPLLLALSAQRGVEDVVLIELHVSHFWAAVGIMAMLEANLACPVCPGVIKPEGADAADPQKPALCIVGEKRSLHGFSAFPVPPLWQWVWEEKVSKCVTPGWGWRWARSGFLASLPVAVGCLLLAVRHGCLLMAVRHGCLLLSWLGLLERWLVWLLVWLMYWWSWLWGLGLRWWLLLVRMVLLLWLRHWGWLLV
jgi:hypothetical protein